MTRRKQNMARRSAASTKKSAARRKPRRKSGSKNLRQTLYGVGLWALGIFNALLIASFIMKHVSSGEEQVLRFDTPPEQTAKAAPVREIRGKIEVLNGCGASGVAKKFADYLKKAGFQPINVGNFENFDMPNTLILDRKATNRYLGLEVAQLLGVSPTYVQYLANRQTRADVTVIIGKDYQKLDFLKSKK